MFTGSITITLDMFDPTIESLADLGDQALEKAVRDIEAKAKTDAPVDTGNLKSAIYSASPKHTTYTGGGDGNDPQEIPGDHEAIVHSGAPYSVYVDYGTVHTPARPFFSAAVAEVKPTLEAVMAKIFEGGLS